VLGGMTDTKHKIQLVQTKKKTYSMAVLTLTKSDKVVSLQVIFLPIVIVIL